MTIDDVIVYNAIEEIIQNKRTANKEPHLATFLEVLGQLPIKDKEFIKRHIRVLLKEGLISYGHTMNSIYFKIKRCIN